MSNAFRGTMPAAPLCVAAPPAHHTVILPIRRHLQATPYSCGPASVRIVLDSLGRPFEESHLASLCHTSPQRGTQPDGIVRALRALRVRHDVVEPADLHVLEERIARFQYCIVDYQAWGRRGRDYHDLRTGHYSVVFGYDRSHLYVADPAQKRQQPAARRGLRTIRKDLFRARWRDRGPGGLRTHRWMLCIPAAQPHVV